MTSIIKGHIFEEDKSTYDINGFTCKKCGAFKFWLMGDMEECPVPDKIPYFDDTDYSQLSNAEIRRRLGSGNVPNDIQR